MHHESLPASREGVAPTIAAMNLLRVVLSQLAFEVIGKNIGRCERTPGEANTSVILASLNGVPGAQRV
jgi:hypothetical protein